MKLRLRLALTTVGIVVPVIVAVIRFDTVSLRRAGEDALAAAALTYMQSGGRKACEASPATWGGSTHRRPPWDGPPNLDPTDEPLAPKPGRLRRIPPVDPPPPQLFAYRRDLRSDNPAAPKVDAALVVAIDSGHDVAGRRTVIDERNTVEVLVRMPWRDGPCEYVLARGMAAPRWVSAALPPLRMWALPVAVVFVVVLLAVGPIVRRLRKLTVAVERSARTGYASQVAVDGGDEIAALARAFDAAGREIREQLAEKERRELALRQFLANTTHDLMIPLTVLQGHLAGMRQRAVAGEAVDAAMVTSAMDEAHYMASLMHNLAIAAKLDTGAPELHRTAVDLNELIARVIGRHAPIARQLEVALDSAVPEMPVIVDGDVTMLEQAISNVVYNAIRHNRAGGHVAVILEQPTAGRFLIRVVDDGPGIPVADRARILEPGVRGGDARTRAPDGQGLGLHITSRVAELHDLMLALETSSYGGLEVQLGGAISPAA